MDEELSDNELEARLYAMIHPVDRTQSNLKRDNQDEIAQILENAPRSTVRRYWHTEADLVRPSSVYSKVNTSNSASTQNQKTASNPKPKEEKEISNSSISTIDLSLLQSPQEGVKPTIEILEHDSTPEVVLESSDEDEVIEVALPPKPTITIESSDEDELQLVKDIAVKSIDKTPEKINDRDVSSSPVPSIVSSVSDEFIRGDCIALNISSRRPDDHSFDFSLHGPDLIETSTPSKKKKKKKSKTTPTSTPVASENQTEVCFATPKSKAKNKKRKSNTLVEKSITPVDVYDLDSNQSQIETLKNVNPYAVTDRSLPSADVYESDSNQSEIVKEKPSEISNLEIQNFDSNLEKPIETQKNKSVNSKDNSLQTVDLTEMDSFPTMGNSNICESIVMGNVTGFIESDEYGDENIENVSQNISKFGSTKIPAILNEDLDFDNLKGKDRVCKKRRYSLTTLRAEMEKFYNESWGGENFNHREIQKNMSRDKSLWAIDPKDKIPPLSNRRKVTCNYCNRSGHRDDTCRMKPPICYMCGSAGHFEPRCPRKICVNCGSPNNMYSTMCRNCNSWGRVTCVECGQGGHPASHCPDIWRRYHNTIDNNLPLEKNLQTKKYNQMYCSGCTRRGHLVHTCRIAIPFSGLPINSPYVCTYKPVYPPSQNVNTSNDNPRNNQLKPIEDCTNTPRRNDRNKRQSKSPTAHETHENKKRNLSAGDESDLSRNTKSPVNPRKTSLSADSNKTTKDSKNTVEPPITKDDSEKAPDFIPISSSNNYDKKGHIIQDNEVSDTSDAVTSAKIFITNELVERLKTQEGQEWLEKVSAENNIEIQLSDINVFLIKGKVADQEAFQMLLRDWSNSRVNNDQASTQQHDTENKSLMLNIPKNRNNILKQLDYALNSLKQDIGDPNKLFKELTYLQSRHTQLLKQRVVSPKQLSNNKGHINEMLRKLNMILLGQAGLADGQKHVSELYSLQQKLQKYSEKIISPELRQEIGQHYHSIFTAMPRDDYSDLLKKYVSRSTNTKFTIEKPFKFRANNKTNLFKKSNCIPPQNVYGGTGKNGNMSNNIAKTNINLKRDLMFCRQKLLNVRPNDSAKKKTRSGLVRKMHSFIASMSKNEKMPSKTMKKMKKVQEQAHKFLASV